MKEEWQTPRAGITCLSWKSNTVAPLGRGPVHQLYVPPCLGGLPKEDEDLGFEYWGLPLRDSCLPCWTPETQFRNWGEGTATILSLGGKQVGATSCGTRAASADGDLL